MMTLALQTENLKKEIETIKKKQMQILELKSIIAEMMISTEDLREKNQ